MMTNKLGIHNDQNSENPQSLSSKYHLFIFMCTLCGTNPIFTPFSHQSTWSSERNERFHKPIGCIYSA